MVETDRKCEVSRARLKIMVPNYMSIEKYKKLTQATLIYPQKTIYKEKDNTYTIVDEAGTKIPNVDVEIIVECSYKEEETSMNINYIRLEGMPSRIAIDEIVYFKPSTKETLKVSKSSF